MKYLSALVCTLTCLGMLGAWTGDERSAPAHGSSLAHVRPRAEAAPGAVRVTEAVAEVENDGFAQAPDGSSALAGPTDVARQFARPERASSHALLAMRVHASSIVLAVRPARGPPARG